MWRTMKSMAYYYGTYALIFCLSICFSVADVHGSVLFRTHFVSGFLHIVVSFSVLSFLCALSWGLYPHCVLRRSVGLLHVLSQSILSHGSFLPQVITRHVIFCFCLSCCSLLRCVISPYNSWNTLFLVICRSMLFICCFHIVGVLCTFFTSGAVCILLGCGWFGIVLWCGFSYCTRRMYVPFLFLSLICFCCGCYWLKYVSDGRYSCH